MITVMLTLLIWYATGFISLWYWTYKSNKRWGFTVLYTFLEHYPYILFLGIGGPCAAFFGYVGYQISKME